MFRKTVFILTVFCVSLGLAQQKKGTGIGIALLDVQQLFEAAVSEGIGLNATIVVPIAASPTLRVEPEFGYFRATEEEKNGTTETMTADSWRIGLGIFPLTTYDSFTLYYGARIGYISQTITFEAGSVDLEETTTGYYIAPVLGGEHSFSNHFSIGGEAQIVYADLSSDSEFTDVEVTRSLLNTRALVFFRFFF